MTDLTKAGASGGSSAPDPATAPSSIVIAQYAAVAQVVFAVLYAIMQWPLGDQLRTSIIKANTRLKTPKVYCGNPKVKNCLDVTSTVHSFQTQTAIGTALISVAIAVVLLRVRKGVRSGRLLYLFASVLGALVGFAASPLSLLSIAASGTPAVLRGLSTLGAAACVVALVMMFRPASQTFFDVRSPRPAAGQARPGLGGLFAPRPRPDAAAANGRSTAAKSKPAAALRSSAATRAQARVAKAKSRNDAESIARGAALARERARASKSRRTDI